MITIDPNELTAASETLHGCATEAADIGSQLWACSCCTMPADIQGVVDQLVVAVDRALDSVAARLDAQAVDLTNRAQIATTDSLAAAGVVVEQNNVTGTTPGPVVYTSIGGSLIDGGVTITTPDLIQAVVGQTIVGGIGIMPGDVTITNPDGTPANNLLGPSVIGPPDYSQGPASGYMALAEVLDKRVRLQQARIDAIVSNPNATGAEFAAAMRAQDGIGNVAATILAPSREEIEASYNTNWLPDDFIHSISPHTPL